MPFLDNKYTKIYYQIVTKYQETDCGEENHFYGKKHTSEDLKKAVENRRRNNGGEYTKFTSGVCQYCGLEFKDLIQHCKENPDRKYTIDTETMDWCQYCGKYFVARSGLKIHENKCKRRYARYA